MIHLDIGILMGSQANFVFNEMLDVYPGAKQLYDAINTYSCDCGDPEGCRRKAFQLVLNQASNGDKEIAAQFIAEALERGINHHEQARDLMVQYYDRLHAGCNHGGEETIIEVNSPEEFFQLLNGLFGGRPLN